MRIQLVVPMSGIGKRFKDAGYTTPKPLIKIRGKEIINHVVNMFEKIEQVDVKLDRHANDIKKGCERDIKLVDARLRTIEKKMWTIAGSLTIISFIVSPIGQRFVKGLTVTPQASIIIEK